MVHSPTIKFSNNLFALSMEDPDKVCEHSLPNTQFKLMHEIHNKKGEKVQPKLGKGGNECTL
jgi:hypothetical protein